MAYCCRRVVSLALNERLGRDDAGFFTLWMEAAAANGSQTSRAPGIPTQKKNKKEKQDKKDKKRQKDQ